MGVWRSCKYLRSKEQIEASGLDGLDAGGLEVVGGVSDRIQDRFLSKQDTLNLRQRDSNQSGVEENKREPSATDSPRFVVNDHVESDLNRSTGGPIVQRRLLQELVECARI